MVSAAVRALLHALPNAEITWITNSLTYSLMKGMGGVYFDVIEKPRTFSNFSGFYKHFRGREFDVVLAMQASLRINLLYSALHAPLKIGFDHARAREGQWLFCNKQIPVKDDHLVDSFLAFVETLTEVSASAKWKLPLDSGEISWARSSLSQLTTPLIAIHPHASKSERNWLPDRYAEVIQNSAASFILTGGNSPEELTLCEHLATIAPQRTLNFCGRTTPKQLAALLSLVDVLIAPDTGAVHIARAMDTPVIGLYAVASPKLTGPYQRQEYCVDRYPQAVEKFLGKDPAKLPWNTRVHHPDAMSLITVDDVMEQIDRVLPKTS